MMGNEKKIVIPRGKSIMPGAILIGLLAASIIYAVLIHAETKALQNYERGSIFVAAKEIPKGEIISEENMDEYFLLKELDKSVIPEEALVSSQQVEGLVPKIDIQEGTLLTGGMFESVNEITKNMREPVVAGFKVDDLYQAVGGVLRTGDYIHIYRVSEEGETSLIWQDIFVRQVFDSVGNVIESDDSQTAAYRVNIYLDKDDVEQFYTELTEGSLRVVKVCQ